MFEIPLNEVTNTSLTAKHEVMIELGGPDGEGGARDKNRKGDQLVEMRFYVPGQANQEGEGEEESNANVSLQDYAIPKEYYQEDRLTNMSAVF
jgi:structure-specific recognition protein 1